MALATSGQFVQKLAEQLKYDAKRINRGRKKLSMAKYVVIPVKNNIYEKNYMVPFLNLITGIIWSIPLIQKFLDGTGTLVKFAFGIVFAFLYVVVTLLPVISVVPCVAGTIIYVGLFWSLADMLKDGWFKITLKIVIAAIIGIIELSLIANATLPWLQTKTDKGPVVRKVED